MTNESTVTLPSKEVLDALETISDQQALISKQLKELLEALTKQPETSLIDQLSALLQPLFEDVAEIKQKVGNLPSAAKG